MIRFYGSEPYRAAVIHGGPGAPGSVACIARELSKSVGTIEPIQTRYSVMELVEELHEQIKSVSENSMTLIGHSWGAWLTVLLAAKYPLQVEKLVLVGSGPFEGCYVPAIMERRLARLSFEEGKRFQDLLAVLDQHDDSKKIVEMNQLAALVEKSDNVDLLTIDTDQVDNLPVDDKMYASVWSEAAGMRRDGRLIGTLEKLACPVHVIQGDGDPHPVDGVIEPLRESHVDFVCYVLKNCGHSPFRERQAYREFYRILGEVLRENRNDISLVEEPQCRSPQA